MYKMDWVSAEDSTNHKKLNDLSKRFSAYYASRIAYYDYISNEGDPWTYANYLPCDEIINYAFKSKRILELGCGRSSILRKEPSLAANYTGVEFSKEVIQGNRHDFPNGTFHQIGDPYRYDFNDASFDFVFSFFVIEHTIFPNLFLDECIRLLQPGGILIIFAPNFLDNNWVVSQRVSDNLKSMTQNFKEFSLINALTTFLYNRLLIPANCIVTRNKRDSFWINCDPACFYFNEIKPDLDASYLTSFKEIEKFVSSRNMFAIQNSAALTKFVSERRLGFLAFKKNVYE